MASVWLLRKVCVDRRQYTAAGGQVPSRLEQRERERRQCVLVDSVFSEHTDRDAVLKVRV